MKQNKIPRNEYIVKPKGKTDPYKDDVQYTNLGQWKYPGQVTKIPSNDITMQGVNYPVYGEDNLGYGQMMYPGMDYTFPGQYVTEIPMAQKGEQVENRTLWGVGSQFIPVYETYLDWKNIASGIKTGNKSDKYAGIIGLAQPFSGKALGNTLDYATEKTLGKKTADYNQKKREDIVNMSQHDREKLFLKYGHGGYDAWAKDGFPELVYGGDPSLPNITGHYQKGGGLTYEHWKKKYKLVESPDYNLKRAWELGYTPDAKGHLPTVDEETGVFLKTRNHPTLRKELDWYNSSAGEDFRNQNDIDSSGTYFKYIPKNKDILKTGGWLDEYQVGGSRFGDLRPTSDATRVVIPNLPKKALTKKEKQEVKQYEIKQAARDLEKAQKTVDKINRIKAANKAQAEQGFPTTRQEWADQTQAIGDKLSLQNLPVVGKYIPDLLDVTGGIGQMATNLGSAPLRAKQEDSYLPYVTAIGEPLLTGALAGISSKPAGQFTNNKNIPDFFSANDAIDYFKNLGYSTKELIKNIPKTVKYSFDNYKELQKLPGQYKNAIKDLTNPEALKRLKNLGVEDADDFINFINNVKINATTEGSHFLPIGPGSVNINPGQLKELKKTVLPLASQESGIDHELGHAIQYYLENKGKTFNRLTDLDIEAVDELSPHLTENVLNFLKNTTGKDYKSARESAKNLGELAGNYLFRNKREPLAHLRETKRSMVDKGIINNINETITPEHIQEFILKGGNEDRILSTLQQTPEARKSLSGLLNRTPAVIPVGTGILGASKLQQEQNGGWLDSYEDEFKKGGQKGLKRFTSKNIQTSINDIMLRNETIYGPSGKRRYKPNLKYQDGGESTNWLDDI